MSSDTLIRNEGRGLLNMRDAKSLCHYRPRETKVASVIAVGETKMFLSVEVNHTEHRPENDYTTDVDFSYASGVVHQERNPFFCMRFVQDMIVNIVDKTVQCTHCDRGKTVVECRILEYDGGISYALTFGLHMLLDMLFGHDQRYSIRTVRGITCGMVYKNFVMDMDRQEFFQSDVVMDALIDHAGNIISIAHYSERSNSGVSLNHMLSMLSKGWHEGKGSANHDMPYALAS
jgi:ribonuclease PH